MSNPQHAYTLQLIAEQRIQQYIRESEIDHLLAATRASGPGWWSRHSQAALRRFGHVLAGLGQRLEHQEIPDARPAREPDALGAMSPNR